MSKWLRFKRLTRQTQWFGKPNDQEHYSSTLTLLDPPGFSLMHVKVLLRYILCYGWILSENVSNLCTFIGLHNHIHISGFIEHIISRKIKHLDRKVAYIIFNVLIVMWRLKQEIVVQERKKTKIAELSS